MTAFSKLQTASLFIRSASEAKFELVPRGRNDLPRGKDTLLRAFGEHIRKELSLIESLSLFVADLPTNTAFRHQPVFIPCGTEKGQSLEIHVDSSAPWVWIVIQVAFAILAGTTATVVVTKDAEEVKYHLDRIFSEIAEETISKLHTSNITTIMANSDTDTSPAVVDGYLPTHVFAYRYTKEVLYSPLSEVVLSSISPPLLGGYLTKEVISQEQLLQQYGCYCKERAGYTNECYDELDLLPDESRMAFIADRERYIFSIVMHTCPFYGKLFRTASASATKAPTVTMTVSVDSLPCITGSDLTDHVPPYGEGITNRENSKHHISFCSGGTTGKPKFVYRAAWEDAENARYLGKGLISAGVNKSDTVMNLLGSGFWGGLHVYTLALGAVGCSIIPIGSSFPQDQLVNFIRSLNPTAILCLPSTLLTLCSYIEEHGITDVVVPKVITGGEVLHTAAKSRLRSVLGITQFVSTGYTSNETGCVGFQCEYLRDTTQFHVHESMQRVDMLPLGYLEEEEEEENRIEMKVPEGEIGLFALSNLNRELMPTLRYVVGDCGRMIVSPQQLQQYQQQPRQPHQRQQPPEPPILQRRCPCGRTLRIIELMGRVDSKIRLNGEDLYVEEVANALAYVQELSTKFQIHVWKSVETCEDYIEIYIEAAVLSSEDSLPALLKKELSAKFLKHFSQSTRLYWVGGSSKRPGNNDDEEEEDVSEELDHDKSADKQPSPSQSMPPPGVIGAPIQCPSIVILPRGGIQTNPRTGKIRVVVDHRVSIK